MNVALRTIAATLLLGSAVVGANAEDIATTLAGHPVSLRLPDEAALAGRAVGGSFQVEIDGVATTVSGEIAIGFPAGTDAAAIAAAHGLSVKSQGTTWAVLAPAVGARSAALRAIPGVTPTVGWVEPVIVRTMKRRADPTDPLFTSQWYLRNDGSITGTVAGNDLNVVPAWEAGITGSGVRVAVIDDGVDSVHEDLAANLDIGNSHDFNGNDGDPSNETGDFHGTAVSGCIAAARNGKGIVGPAYGAKLEVLRLISAPFTSADAAAAFNWKKGNSAEPAIFNNSWGPQDDGVDDGADQEEPTALEVAAWADGVATGRSGKGSIYVFASGNGGSNDTCDRDGFAANRLVMAIGASRADGKLASYSERGVCLFANAPVGDSSAPSCLTTDNMGASGNPDSPNPGNYAPELGTSFAAPQACAVIALMLQANPRLTWRDVRAIIAKTSTKNDPDNAGWIVNAANYHWNPAYGFGRLDAAAAVTAARTFRTLAGEVTPPEVTKTPDLPIPDLGTSGVVDLPIAAGDSMVIESVEFTVDCSSTYQGDLEFQLTSPSGTVIRTHNRDFDDAPARAWTFNAVGFWGERPNGTWHFAVYDVLARDSGNLNSVTLKIHGRNDSTSTVGGGSGGGGTTAGGTTAGSTTAGSTTAGSTTGGPSGSAGGVSSGGGGGVSQPAGTGSVSGDNSGGGCGAGGGLAVLFGLLAFVRLIRAPRRQ